jgi:aminopeptidase N
MIVRTLFTTLAFIIIASACHTNKKNTKVTSTQESAISLDTIKVVANETLKKEVYRESNAKLTDIIHTRLDVDFDWTNSRMNGIATLDLKQHFYSSSKLYLNARGMDINKVEVFQYAPAIETKKEGNKTVETTSVKPSQITTATFKYENDSIKIDLGRVFGSKEKYQVVINYVSKPNELKNTGGSSAISSDKGLYFINPKGGNIFQMPQIWTQGETQSNSVWFPTIDSPNSKTTQEIFMTVDEKYTTLSNGLLVDSKKNAGGTRTDHWKLDDPHAPYLAMMAVGQFKKVVDEPWNGKEISYYVEKEYEPHAKGIFGNTREMIEFYSNKLGFPYAWPKYAQIVAREYVSGAMENTSATLHGEMVAYQSTRELLDGNKAEDVISHELFHQWFGDVVTCESWSNLPLNESFATYGEYLWQEYKNGREAADHHHASSRQGYLSSDKEVNLIRFNVEEREDMFDAFSYSKGGQVLHMLRKAVGDDAFFASLKNYLETNKFKSVEIHNLRLAFEDVTGQDMNWFFNEWFLNKGRPKIKVTQTYNAVNYDVELTVEQNQDLKAVPLYKLPIDIDVYYNGGVRRTRIWVTEKKQTFKIKSDGLPQLINFDAERQLLCDLDYIKTDQENIFQYKNAPLYGDRTEALKALETKLADKTVFDLFKWAAENDKYYAVRNYAITKLVTAPAEKMAEVKTVLLNVYNNDKKTTTRAKALSLLNKKFSKDGDMMPLNEKALSEVSYAINGEALDAIAKANPKLAMEKARLFEGENGKDVIFPIADLYANNGGDDQIAYFQNTMKYMNGFEIVSFCNFYAKTAKRCNNPVNILTAAKDLESIGSSTNRFTKYGAIKGLRDISVVCEGKEKTAKAKLEAAKSENKDVTAIEKEYKILSETKEAVEKMYKAVK